MLAGMDTSDRDHVTPYGRAPRPGSSLWTIIGVTGSMAASVTPQISGPAMNR